MLDELPGKKRDEMTLVIDGQEIAFEEMTLAKTMDTIADSATATIPWTPGKNKKFDDDTKPYKFTLCDIYIGGKLQSEMVLYNVFHEKSDRGRIKRLEMFSKTADLIDSNVLAPYEENVISLSERCRHQCEPFGIMVAVGDDVAAMINETHRVSKIVGYRASVSAKGFDGKFGSQWTKIGSDAKYIPIKKSKIIIEEKKFQRVSAKPTDKIFEHLAKYAKQRGVILSCTKHGDLLLTRANLDTAPVCTIDESEFSHVPEFKIGWEGRKRFRVYKAIQKTATGKIQTSALDTAIPTPRIMQFDAGDDVPGNAKNAAEWMRNKMAAQSLKDNDFEMTGFYIPGKNDLWQCNTTVTVKSETMGIPDGYTFLITQTEFRSSSSGLKTAIKIIPPSMYGTGDIEEP